MYIHTLKIGNVELKNNVILAPMAGITDLPFRVIAKKFGPGMVCTEMASTKAIFYNDYKTQKIMKVEKEEKPVSVQLFGSDLKAIEYATKKVTQFADIIDINMGCPAPKVTKGGDGSKLLLNLPQAEQVIKTVVQNSTVPVTLKFRKGWDSKNIVACELAQIAEKEGISMLTIHGRTRDEYYSGMVDKDIIKKVKQSVNIPVVASGDIIDEESAKEMFEYTGVDGIMIGRAAIGNPWIFTKIIHYLKTGEKLNIPTNKERLKIIKEHINLAVEEKGEEVAIKEMRKHLACYTKNLKNSAAFRNNINKIETKKEVIEALEEYFKTL